MKACSWAIAWISLLLGCEAHEDPGARAAPTSVEATAPAAAAAPEKAPAPTPETSQDALCSSAESCFDAASEAERAHDPKRAAPLYQRACELGIGQACHRLGVMHLEGKGVARDDDKARELFEVGCRQDSAAACDALGH